RASRGLGHSRHRTYSDVFPNRGAALDRGDSCGRGADVCAHARRIRRRAHGRWQHSRSDANGFDFDLRRRAEPELDSRPPDGARAPRFLIRGALDGLRAAAQTLGGCAGLMSLSIRVRKRLSPAFLPDVTFEGRPGVTIVFGESGSGKTTLLRCVAGLGRPDEGRIVVSDRVFFDGETGVDLEPARRATGFVFQHLALFPHLSAAQNIAYGLSHFSTAERSARTTAIAASFRIRHVLDR